MTLELHTVAHYSAMRIMDSLIEGTLISLFAMIVLRFARRQSAGTRFAVWFSALIAIAAVPFVNGVLSSFAVVPSSLVRHPEVTVSESWALYIFAGWAAIAGWFLLGVARSLWHIQHVRKNSIPVEISSLDPLLQTTFRGAGTGRKVELYSSKTVHVPTAIGLMKPGVVLPEWALRELSSAELNQILLHELAHLQRWDDWTNLVQQIVRAIFFFHPAVWWIEKNVALEREMACDDAVLAHTPSPMAYAECLAHLAERSFAQRSLALAQAALGRARQISTRVAQILDRTRPRGQVHKWKPAVALVLGFSLASVIGFSRAPRLIAFKESGSLVDGTAQFHEETSDRELPESIPVIPAKLNLERAQHVQLIQKKKPAAHPAVLKPRAGSLVHLAAAKVGAVPVTETLFVVIQNQDQAAPDVQMYQIQVWHVVLLRYPVKPASLPAPVHKT